MDGRQLGRRRFLAFLGAGGAVAGSATVAYVAGAAPTRAAEATSREDGAYTPANHGRQQVVWSVDTAEPAVALTFDDGPLPTFTPRVLDALAAAGAHATFFVIGRLAERSPGLLRRIEAEGHEVANHTWSHTSAALQSAEASRADIDRATELLARTLRTPPRWYRPPRGMLTGSALEHAHLRGQGVAMWSGDRGPAADGDVAGVRRHLVEQLQPGAVVNLHDGVGAAGTRPSTEWPVRLVRRRETELAALGHVLAEGAARGIRFLTLSDLVALGT